MFHAVLERTGPTHASQHAFRADFPHCRCGGVDRRVAAARGQGEGEEQGRAAHSERIPRARTRRGGASRAAVGYSRAA